MIDKRGIHLKMHEMAILETLISTNFCGGMPPDPSPLETGAFLRPYKHIWPAFGVLKLGAYVKLFQPNVIINISITFFQTFFTELINWRRKE